MGASIRAGLLAGAMVVAACGGGGDDGSGAAETTTTTAAPDAPDLFANAGLTDIELTSPTDGGGQRPTLTWGAVEGAASYSVTVVEQDGDPYWAWEGAETTVRFGLAPDGAPGARSWWSP